jgi:excinuclease ABC subunit B
MYADKITESMRKTIEDNEKKRAKQMTYNTLHGITPTTVIKSKDEIIKQTSVADAKISAEQVNYYVEPEEPSIAADPIVQFMSKPQLEKTVQETQKRMAKASKEMDFMEAARLRDELFGLQKKLEELAG